MEEDTEGERARKFARKQATKAAKDLAGLREAAYNRAREEWPDAYSIVALFYGSQPYVEVKLREADPVTNLYNYVGYEL